MALDIEKLKKAQLELQARMNRGSGPNMKFWKPAAGDNKIRVMPGWTDEGEFSGQFWREVHQHWNVTEEGGPILCPKKTPNASVDKECPICDLVDTLKGKKSDVEAQELVKKMRAKVAYLMSVVDISDPVYTAKDVADWSKERPDAPCPFTAGDTKVQCYAAAGTVAEPIMNVVIANGLDITDLSKGHNIIINKLPNKDPMKTRYTVTPEIKASKAPVKADFKAPDLSKIGAVRKFDDLVKLLSEGPAGSYAGALPSENPTWANTHEVVDPTVTSSVDGTDDLAAQMRAQLNK